MTFNARYLELAGIALNSAQKQQLAEAALKKQASGTINESVYHQDSLNAGKGWFAFIKQDIVSGPYKTKKEVLNVDGSDDFHFNCRYGEVDKSYKFSDLDEPKQKIAEGSGDIARGVEDWMEATNTYHFEGARGVRSFESLIRVIGYSSLGEFLEDNPGCLAAMVEWIGKQRMPEWSESFAAYAKGKKED